MPAKAQDLPGVEGEGVAPKRIKAIDVAAGEYVEIRDERMKHTKKEVAARDKLVDLMKKNELTKYHFSDEEVILVPGKDKVRVRCVDLNKEDGEDEGED